jgi:phage virion morphogenesis protein
VGVAAVNLRDFEDFRERMRDAAAARFMPEIATRVGAALVKQVADEFRESRDPYGRAWAPVFRRVKGRKGLVQGKPLIKTGRLRASVVAKISGSEVRIALPVEYASYHQFGTRTIPQRQILPDTGAGLGPRWSAAVSKEIKAVLNKNVGGRR